MKISAAQIRSKPGAILENLEKHLLFVEEAVKHNSDLIFFPELSMSNYEPELAQQLATTIDDPMFDDFQILANNKLITIALGMPIKGNSGIQISLILFQPDKNRQVYAKQILHEDEMPYFVPGAEHKIISNNGIKIAFAICYESLKEQHFREAKNLGADIYLASVAKTKNGVFKAQEHFPKMAQEYRTPILMSNSIGPSDNFITYGNSAVWSAKGASLGSFDHSSEGIITFDTITENCEQWKLS